MMIDISKTKELKPLEERTLWPMDWPDIKCPACSSGYLGLLHKTNNNRMLQCVCFSCHRHFGVKNHTGKWEYKLANEPYILRRTRNEND